jgi:PKD repeat protein
MNTTPPNTDWDAPAGRPSFLDQILSESAVAKPTEPAPAPVLAATTVPATVSAAVNSSTQQTATVPAPMTAPGGGNVPPKPPIKKTPITPGQIVQMLGALLFVALVFFGSFLAYIVFNPAQARFFNTFGINTLDVASLLSQLVNGIFGALTFILSCLFAYFLFRTYLAKGAPKKRAINAIIATFVGLILFSNIGFWAYLFGKIGAADFVRPSGGVIVYDNELALSDLYKNQADISDPVLLSSLIGPATLRYDLSSDARYASKSIEITSFAIDCEGDGTVEHEGSSPETDASLVCEYARKGSYTPKGSYKGRDNVTRDPITLDIQFLPVKIIAVVDIKRTDSTIVLDAADAAVLGKVKWYTGKTLDTLASEEAKFSTKISDVEQYVCLNTSAKGACARVFTIKPKIDAPIVGTIKIDKDSSDPLKYNFRLVDARAKSGGEIEKYSWFIDDSIPISREDVAQRIFSGFGTYKISVELTDSARNKVTLSEKFKIDRPLLLVRKSGSESLLRITGENGESLIAGAFSNDLWAYVVEGTTIPQKISFDATDMRVKNEGYTLKEVTWKIGNDDRKGLKISYDFVEEKRHDVTVNYIFAKTGTTDEISVVEKIIIDGKSREITPKLIMTAEGGAESDSLFAPLNISFDASASKVRSGRIAQFFYDFGEGRGTAEGGAVSEYRYTIPGVYTVKLTVQKDDGSKDAITRQIVIKEMPKKLSVSSSVSSGIVGKTVEFTTEGTIGQVQSYSWDFGDGSSSVTEPNPNHTFEKTGKYTVKLSATYADGTIGRAEMSFEVGE